MCSPQLRLRSCCCCFCCCCCLLLLTSPLLVHGAVLLVQAMAHLLDRTVGTLACVLVTWLASLGVSCPLVLFVRCFVPSCPLLQALAADLGETAGALACRFDWPFLLLCLRACCRSHWILLVVRSGTARTIGWHSCNASGFGAGPCFSAGWAQLGPWHSLALGMCVWLACLSVGSLPAGAMEFCCWQGRDFGILFVRCCRASSAFGAHCCARQVGALVIGAPGVESKARQSRPWGAKVRFRGWFRHASVLQVLADGSAGSVLEQKAPHLSFGVGLCICP